MSVNYYPDGPVEFDIIFGGRLASEGVSESVTADSTQNSRALTDGKNTLWVYRGGDGTASATVYGANDPTKILHALEKIFGVQWFDEDDMGEDESEEGNLH